MNFLRSIYREGHRKAVMALGAFIAITTYAYTRGATFAEYASAVEWVLGIVLTGHVAQQATAKPQAKHLIDPTEGP